MCHLRNLLIFFFKIFRHHRHFLTQVLRHLVHLTFHFLKHFPLCIKFICLFLFAVLDLVFEVGFANLKLSFDFFEHAGHKGQLAFLHLGLLEVARYAGILPVASGEAGVFLLYGEQEFLVLFFVV